MTMDVNSPEAAQWSQTMRLKSENEHLRAVLTSVLGDKDMAQALWGGLPDDATMNITIKLGVYRQAQAALNPHYQHEDKA